MSKRGKVVLLAPQPQVEEVITVSGIDDLIPICRDEAEAIAAVMPSPGLIPPWPATPRRAAHRHGTRRSRAASIPGSTPRPRPATCRRLRHEKMHVALEEAVMNVAMHAYPPGESARSPSACSTTADAASLVIEDAGPAFDPTSAADAPARRDQHGGHPTRRPGPDAAAPFLRRYRLRTHRNRNRLTLRFPLAGEALANPPEEPSAASVEGRVSVHPPHERPKRNYGACIGVAVFSQSRPAFRPGISGAAAPPRHR